jgi:predicted DNA-binding antitoxin AbrB/MazE fold protein
LKSLNTKKKLNLAEGKEVTIEIQKSKVDKLTGLLGDINIDSVELQHSTKDVWTKKSKFHC